MEIFEELKEKSLPFIEAYHDDLLKHDGNHIANNPNRRFIHFTGSTGTYLVTFLKFEDYPKPGERVPYLFSVAGRDHILSQIKVVVDCMQDCNRMELIMYFDGQRLKQITYDKAKEITEEYTRHMKSKFRKGRNFDTYA